MPNYKDIKDNILSEVTELFFTPDNQVFISIKNNDHIENWPLRSKRFQLWLNSMLYESIQDSLSKYDFEKILDILEAHGLNKSIKKDVFTRVASNNNKVFLDLVSESWEVVEISANGWKITQDPPIKFRRTDGMYPLPHPKKDGSLDALRPFITISDCDHWKLFISWLVGALNPKGSYPILVFQGEQGSGKSLISRLVRSIIDPSKALLRSMPKNERDLMIAANNSWILSFDNISSLPRWLSDALCRISTGGGYSVRRNYTDDEEVIFNVTRPICLNGITNFISRGDLLDRSIIINLPPILQKERRSEDEIMQEFNEALPAILGAICDAVSTALKNRNIIKPSVLPRMADFTKWVIAAEPSLPWSEGEFLKAYTKNMQESLEQILDTNPVEAAIRYFIERQGMFDGTPTELLEALKEYVPDKIRKSKNWPKQPNILSRKLNEIIPSLRAIGIEIETERDSHNRHIYIENTRPDFAKQRLIKNEKGEWLLNLRPSVHFNDDNDDIGSCHDDRHLKYRH